MKLFLYATSCPRVGIHLCMFVVFATRIDGSVNLILSFPRDEQMFEATHTDATNTVCDLRLNLWSGWTGGRNAQVNAVSTRCNRSFCANDVDIRGGFHLKFHAIASRRRHFDLAEVCYGWSMVGNR